MKIICLMFVMGIYSGPLSATCDVQPPKQRVPTYIPWGPIKPWRTTR